MNIHLKIEAKQTLVINGSKLTLSAFNSPNITRANAIKMIYTVFNNDTFLLPYKVQKLSKRARHNLI